jgi:hypothetical protein
MTRLRTVNPGSLPEAQRAQCRSYGGLDAGVLAPRPGPLARSVVAGGLGSEASGSLREPACPNAMPVWLSHSASLSRT